MASIAPSRVRRTLSRPRNWRHLRHAALAVEIEERWRGEVEQPRAKDSLEARVAARTIELLETNSRLEFELTERRRAEERSAAFITLGQRLNSTSSEVEAARIIVQVADELIGWDACYLNLHVAAEDRFCYILEVDIVDGRRTEMADASTSEPPTLLLQTVMQEGGRLFFQDDADGILANASRFGDTSRPAESIITVPIRHGLQMIGMVSIQSYTPHVYDAEALCTLQGLADHCGGALERMSAVRELKEYTQKLEHSNRELQEFAYVASHDLQEPLRKVQAFGDRLRDRYGVLLDDQGRDYLNRMQNAAARMQTLIDGLLTYSRITTKAQPFISVDLDQVAAEVVSDLETRIDQVGGRVELGPLGCIEADPLQMRQLLQNLIGNALKFHRPDDPPVVKVSVESGHMLAESEDQNPVVRAGCFITVADNGIGFEEKYLDRIFQVFQRLHGRGAYEGAGIGLAVCRKIAERHGGGITARSVPGQGSTFQVQLPQRHNREQAA